jgi:FtsH-binding integral membrane protein
VAQQFVRFDPEAHEQQMLKSAVVADLEPMWRKAFIGKVYTLLAIQIAITIAISYGMMQFGGYGFYVWSHTEGAWTRLASIVASIGLIVAMFCNKARYPLNLVLLLAFTCAMSYSIGMVTTTYAVAGMQTVVIEAFALTSLVFIGLTVFTIWSKIDFSFLGLVLPVLLFTLIIWGFFGMFAFQSFAFQQVYALGGTLIFSLYVLYDTWMITQVRRHQ